jgi:hypothetical protein
LIPNNTASVPCGCATSANPRRQHFRFPLNSDRIFELNGQRFSGTVHSLLVATKNVGSVIYNNRRRSLDCQPSSQRIAWEQARWFQVSGSYSPP